MNPRTSILSYFQKRRPSWVSTSSLLNTNSTAQCSDSYPIVLSSPSDRGTRPGVLRKKSMNEPDSPSLDNLVARSAPKQEDRQDVTSVPTLQSFDSPSLGAFCRYGQSWLLQKRLRKPLFKDCSAVVKQSYTALLEEGPWFSYKFGHKSSMHGSGTNWLLSTLFINLNQTKQTDIYF